MELPDRNILSCRVLKNRDLSKINESSTPSKVRLFPSLQIIHIRHRRIDFQISPLRTIIPSLPVSKQINNRFWHNPSNRRERKD